jgi:hypothetical protein
MADITFNTFKPLPDNDPKTPLKNFGLPNAEPSADLFISIFKEKHDQHDPKILPDKEIFNLEKVISDHANSKAVLPSKLCLALLGLAAVALLVITIAIPILSSFTGIVTLTLGLAVLIAMAAYGCYIGVNDRIALSKHETVINERLARLVEFICKYGDEIEKAIQEKGDVILTSQPGQHILALRKLFKTSIV